MGLRPAKVDHQAITEVLGDIAVIGLYHLSRRCLVGAHHGAVVFGIELAGELCGVDQVTEHHRYLPTFGFGGGMGRRRGYSRHLRWHCQSVRQRQRGQDKGRW
jgi:hypothetical protein